MLWYKAWLETRWRFLIGLVLMSCFSALVTLTYPLTKDMQVAVPDLGERVNAMVREAMALVSTYPGYVWSQWFAKNLVNTWVFFAVLLGVGGVVTEATRGSALWTLSLPVTRRRLLGVRASVGALELLALSVGPSLLVPALSPLVGKSYPLGDTLVYSLTAFTGGLVFYGLSVLLSTIFADQIKPIIIGVGVLVALGALSLVSDKLATYSVFNVMSAQTYFMTGALPWAGLAASLSLAAVTFFAALRVLERRDF